MTCFVQIAFHLSFFFLYVSFFYMCECVHVRIFYVAFLLPLAISKIKRLKPTVFVFFFVCFLLSLFCETENPDLSSTTDAKHRNISMRKKIVPAMNISK